MHFRRPFHALLILLFASPALSNAQSDDRPEWEQEAMLIYSESSSDFTRLRTLGHKNPRLLAYTRALEVLFGDAPPPEGALPHEEATRVFNMLIAENDGDPVGMASRYYLARIAQSNPVELDLGEAKKLYLALFERHPDRFFGQMAFIKYATIEIYEGGETGSADAAARLSALEPMVAKITFPEMRRNLRRIMGEAYHSFGLDPRKAYEHLNAACELGQPVPSIREETLVTLAEVAEQIGETERALRAYEELVLLAPRAERAAEFNKAAKRLRAQLVAAPAAQN